MTIQPQIKSTHSFGHEVYLISRLCRAVLLVQPIPAESVQHYTLAAAPLPAAQPPSAVAFLMYVNSAFLSIRFELMLNYSVSQGLPRGSRNVNMYSIIAATYG